MGGLCGGSEWEAYVGGSASNLRSRVLSGVGAVSMARSVGHESFL